MKKPDISPMTVIYAIGTSEPRLGPGIVLALDRTYRPVIRGAETVGYRKTAHTVQFRIPVLLVPADVDPAEAARIAEVTVAALDRGEVPVLPNGYALVIRHSFRDVRRTWAEQAAVFEQARERTAQVTARVEQARQVEDAARTRVQDLGSEGIARASLGTPVMPRTWVELERLCEAYAAEWAARRAES